MLLDGVRVLDLSRLLPGPFATRLLADLGADVVKVEDLAGGDPLRVMLPGGDGGDADHPDGDAEQPGGGESLFSRLHRGKRGIRLNLKDPRGRAAFLRLAAGADAVVEGFRPGVLDRLGLGWDELGRVNPRLVLCSVCGYGGADAERNRAGHDLNYQALSGLLSLMPPGPGGAPALPPLPVADLAGGLLGALAVAAGVLRARVAGVGGPVQVSMLDGLLSLIGVVPAISAGAGLRRDTLLLAGRLACYHTYATADGRAVALAALEPRFWAAFCRAAGRADWIPRQYDPDQEALKEELAKWFLSQPLSHWAELAARAPDACLEPVLSPGEAPGPPAGSPLVVGGIRPAAGHRVPAYGEHTRDILSTVGYTSDELDELARAGVI